MPRNAGPWSRLWIGASASRQLPSGSWRPPEPEATKSTTMPEEPSAPEICDRPPEKHKQLSAPPGNLTLSRPFKGFLLPFVDDLRSQVPPKKGLNQLRGSLCTDRTVGVREWLA